MSKSLSLFALGILVHTLYVLIVLVTDSVLVTHWQVDSGQLTDLIHSFRVNSESYIQPGENYLEKGIFGVGMAPDHYRTIGYPAFIALFKYFMGPYWFFGVTIVQLIVGALIYPLAYKIGNIYFPNDKRTTWIATVLMMLLGGYYTQSMYIMTDLLFSFFFLLGVYFSLESTVKNKPIILLFAILSFIFTGLIRPTLILFPIAYCIYQIHIANYYDVWKIGRVKRMIWVSSLVLIIACNLSSIRVYYHYNTFSPSNVLGINMFDYTVKEVLLSEGEKEQFQGLNQTIDSEESWMEKDKLKKKYFFETIVSYPVSSISYWLSVVNAHMFFPHYWEIGAIYGVAKKNRPEHNLKKSTFMVVIHYLFWIINVMLFTAFLLYLLAAFLGKKEKYGQLLFISMVLIVGLLVGSSFLASAGPRIRLPIEPFILIFSMKYIADMIRSYRGLGLKAE